MPSTRTRLATMGLFFILGFITASWGIYIPTLKEKFHLNPAELSIAFFAIAIGSITALSYLGRWIGRAGNRAVCTIGGTMICVGAAGIVLAPSFAVVIALLSLFGVGTAILDVGINAQASMLEKSQGKPLMSSMHCLHSVGGIAGAAGGGIVLSHHISPSTHFISVALASLLLIFFFRLALTGKPLETYTVLPDAKTTTTQDRFSNYKRTTLLTLGGLAFTALCTESAINNWINVYIRENLQAGMALSSSAYAAYLAGVASGRLIGDFLRIHLGNAPLFALSGWTACISFTAGLLLTSPHLTLISFALAGLGFANIYPIVLLSAGHIKGIPPAQGIARVARIGYIGPLIGPVLVGGIAQLTSLPIGLALIPLCAALVAFIGPRTIRCIWNN